MLRSFFGALIFGLLAACGAAAQTAQGVADDGVYRLAPGDRIEITVLEDPSLNRQALILPDGRVSLPIAGTIVAAGSTPDQVAASVRSRLAGIFVSPPTVSVAAIGLAEAAAAEEEEPPALVWVIGQVASPGAFPLEEDKPRTVIQALALAGGPGPFAARSRIQVHRTVDGAKVVEIFDYSALEDGRAAELGAVLSEGDVIVVPERSLFD